MATRGDNYTSPFMYECTDGHWQEGPHALEACRVCIKGEPCAATLVRVNAGGKRWKAA